MIKLEIKDNTKEVIVKFNRKLKAVNASIIEIVNETAANIQSTAKQKYILEGVGKNAPPHPRFVTSRFGRLRRSIKIRKAVLQQLGKDKWQVEALVGTDNKAYGAIHEFGGAIKHTSKKGKIYVVNMPPRPYLRPAYTEQADKFFQKINKALSEQL